MPTIKEIARLANVSPSTVSNVINGRTNKMKPETLEKVQRILGEQKYVSNMGGRMLAKNGSRLIAVVMTYTRANERHAIQDPFFSELIGALESEIRKNGYFMILYTSTSAEESIRMAASWNIEGIILQGCAPWDCERYLENDVPLVFIDSYYEHRGKLIENVGKSEKYVNVGLNDYNGGQLMAQHLIDCGHKRVAFLADEPEPFGVDEQRRRGFRDTLVANGLEFSIEDDFYSFSFRKGERVEFFKKFAQTHMKKYTALFFASDFYAIDATNVFEDMGISIPDDISITGFDNNIFSTVARPPLTTISQNVSLKAVYAVDTMMKLLRGEKIDIRDRKLDVELKVRSSSGEPPQK